MAFRRTSAAAAVEVSSEKRHTGSRSPAAVGDIRTSTETAVVVADVVAWWPDSVEDEAPVAVVDNWWAFWTKQRLYCGHPS